MASQLALPPLVVDVSDDESSYSQLSVPSEQESTIESANSSSSINKSKFTVHFRSVCVLKPGLSLGTKLRLKTETLVAKILGK